MAVRYFGRSHVRWLTAAVAVAAIAGCSEADPSAGVPSESPTRRASSASAAAGEVTTAPNPFAGDDSLIAYQTDRTGEAVWPVHPDGTEDHQRDADLSHDYMLPDWSPDGSRLVFTTRGGETEPLFEYDLVTEKDRQQFACEDPCLGDDEPAYSSDGQTVAFIRALSPLVNDVPSDCGIWLGDRQTGQVRQLTSNTKPPCDREYLVRWSPDGKQLTYHRELISRSGELTTAVFTLGAEGAGERRLTSPSVVAGEPAYSPDGEWIVFSTYPLNVFQASGDSQLYRMHPDGTGTEQLTRFTDLRATQPRYSPDGRWILFTAVTPSHRHLWAIPAEGGTPVVIADRETIYTHGAWQPTP